MIGDFGYEEVPATLFSNDAWLSLTGLLNPLDFVVTVDHSRVWRHHLAWAKTDGAKLKNLTVQHLSTNMLFLSLLLTSELMVLFNSSTPASQMRNHMKDGDFGTLAFWTGFVLIFSIGITGISIVANSTAWKMVSAISESNIHTILRSSIGLFVTQFPARLSLLALYSFFVWMGLFVIQLLVFPFCVIILVVHVVILYQMIMVYSAFGRIILYTGAMGEKKVLDPDFEESLLSSGLHASLLIKASARAQKHRTTAEMQYAGLGRPQDTATTAITPETLDKETVPRTLETGQTKTHHRYATPTSPLTGKKTHHRYGTPTTPLRDDMDAWSFGSLESPSQPRSVNNRRAWLRRRKSKRLLREWEIETDVRNAYDKPLPTRPPLVEEESFNDHLDLPEPSILNQTFNLQSLRELANRHSGGKTDKLNLKPRSADRTKYTQYDSPHPTTIYEARDSLENQSESSAQPSNLKSKPEAKAVTPSATTPLLQK